MWVALLGLLPVVLASSAALAGSVFMKNGYIIQGSIVDRDDTSVVLGWPNGKVAIARRFIDTVVYEPVEEQNLTELELLRRELEEGGANEESFSLLADDRAIDLPPTLEGFMKTYKIEPEVDSSTQPVEPIVTAGGDPNPGTIVVNDPGVVNPGVVNDPGSSTTPEPMDDVDSVATTIGPSPELLGELVHDAKRSVSIRPPNGWTRVAGEEAFQVVGESDGGFRPSLNIVVLPVGTLSSDEYASLVKQEQSRLLEEYEVLNEGPRDVGVERGFEVIAQGSFGGQEAVLRQCIVIKDERLWILSAFTADSDPEGDFGRIEETLKTVDFNVE